MQHNEASQTPGNGAVPSTPAGGMKVNLPLFRWLAAILCPSWRSERQIQRPISRIGGQHLGAEYAVVSPLYLVADY